MSRCRVGSAQRWIRVILGVALMTIGILDLFSIGAPRHVLSVVGVILLSTGAIGVCPLACLVSGGRGRPAGQG